MSGKSDASPWVISSVIALRMLRGLFQGHGRVHRDDVRAVGSGDKQPRFRHSPGHQLRGANFPPRRDRHR